MEKIRRKEKIMKKKMIKKKRRKKMGQRRRNLKIRMIREVKFFSLVKKMKIFPYRILEYLKRIRKFFLIKESKLYFLFSLKLLIMFMKGEI
jgi:hypothetical protein